MTTISSKDKDTLRALVMAWHDATTDNAHREAGCALADAVSRLIADDEYVPEPGDVVRFPLAPSHWNRRSRYVIMAVSGTHVRFRHEDVTPTVSHPPYENSLKKLRALGMQRAS